MKINIICIGRLKEKYWTLAADEYLKRLSRFSKLSIIELADEKAPEALSEAEAEIVRAKEGERIQKAIKGGFNILLDIKGKELGSKELSDFMACLMQEGKSELNFIIGGSLGVSDEIKKLADFSVSFSKMTFPHQLMRIILLEQIYRAFKIMNNEPYHK